MISWRDEMSVGVAAIDDDHKALISTINEFEACRTHKCAETVCKKLYGYSQTHFQREEAIQEAFRYSDLKSHKDEHALILKRLRVIIRTSFIEQYSDIDDLALIGSLTGLMRDWVIGHVLQSDLAMRDFYKSARKSEQPLLPPIVYQVSGTATTAMHRAHPM